MAATSILATGTSIVRSYEDAATAIGRLDASARLASAGERELLTLRTIAAPLGAGAPGIIALLRNDGEGDPTLAAYAEALRAGASRAKGGVLPTTTLLYELLGLPASAGPAKSFDDLIRDAHERTPPLLKAALAVLEIHAAGDAVPQAAGRVVDHGTASLLAPLATTLILCVGGATTDAWLTLPHERNRASPRPASTDSDRAAAADALFAALAREARAAERGIAAAREAAERDQGRVRRAFGRAAYSALDLLGLIREELVVTVPHAARALGVTAPTAGAAMARLWELGIAREVTGKARLRAFVYEEIVRAVAPPESLAARLDE